MYTCTTCAMCLATATGACNLHQFCTTVESLHPQGPFQDKKPRLSAKERLHPNKVLSQRGLVSQAAYVFRGGNCIQEKMPFETFWCIVEDMHGRL